MDQLSATEIEQARFVSLLSEDPVAVKDDVYVWNGILINRSTALIALLRTYCQLPVSDYLKTKLFHAYSQRFEDVDAKYLMTSIMEDRYQIGQEGVWFYQICREIKGRVAERSETEIKRLIILLHS